MSPVLVFLPLTYIFLWPIVSYILRRDGQHQSALLIGLTAVSLSTGTLGVLLFWAGLLPGRLITAWLAPGIIVIGLGTGLVVNPGWLSPARWLAYWKRGVASVLRSPVEMLLIAATLCAGVIILAYDLYYPFLGDDTLVRYGWQAQEIYASGRLPESVWGYPPLAQMNMATAWLLAGRPVEQMARLFPAVMALGTLGATFLLGRQVHSRQAGLMGAVVLALTPMFINNATLAYTDIPTAFPLTLAAVFMLRWWESDTLTDALFAGLLLAAALFTKQSALTWAVSMAAIALLKGMVKGHGLLEIAASLLALFLPSLVIAVPWYVRNGLLAGPGNILPVAGLYHVLGPDSSWLGLIPSLAWPGEFGFVLTAFYTVGWVAGFYRAIQQGWRLLTRKAKSAPVDFILAIMIIPYWIAWWWRFSFEARFLLLAVPLMAVWAARPLLWALGWLKSRVTIPGWIWQSASALGLAGLLAWGAADRLGGLYWAATHLTATTEERAEHVNETLIRLVRYVRDNFNPGEVRLYLLDERLRYYLADYNTKVGYPYYLVELEGYDYIIYSSSYRAIYGDGRLGWQDSEFYNLAYAPLVFEPVCEVNGVHIMRILRTTVPAPEEIKAYEESSL